jgi:hypothetical protein
MWKCAHPHPFRQYRHTRKCPIYAENTRNKTIKKIASKFNTKDIMHIIIEWKIYSDTTRLLLLPPPSCRLGHVMIYWSVAVYVTSVCRAFPIYDTLYGSIIHLLIRMCHLRQWEWNLKRMKIAFKDKYWDCQTSIELNWYCGLPKVGSTSYHSVLLNITPYPMPAMLKNSQY